ncbi:hypothetical protein FSACADC3378_DKGBJENM_01015 [Fructilactobacillus sanfranciscensis]
MKWVYYVVSFMNLVAMVFDFLASNLGMFVMNLTAMLLMLVCAVEEDR